MIKIKKVELKQNAKLELKSRIRMLQRIKKIFLKIA